MTANTVKQITYSPCKMFGVSFTATQMAALEADKAAPRWDLNPPQRENHDNDIQYAFALRGYADRLAASKAPEKMLAAEKKAKNLKHRWKIASKQERASMMSGFGQHTGGIGMGELRELASKTWDTLPSDIKRYLER